jgi:chain length determinant protein EpsF
VKLLKLDQDPTIKALWSKETRGKGDIVAWAAARLERGLTVKPLEASILEISYKSEDPVFAAAAANAIAQAYTDTLVALKVGPATQYAHWFGEQSKALRAELEKAQARLAAYQKKAGILVSDERMDAETARLNELSSKLAAVEGQTAEARSRQQTGSAAASLPATSGTLGGDTIQKLRTQIDEKEVALRNASVNLGTNHPTYRALKAQLDELEQKLASETQHVTRSFAVARSVGKRTEADLRAAIAAQKAKVLQMQEKRGQMDILKRDVDRAQAAYDAVAKPLAQTNLESRATETNVTVLTPAVPPTEPSFPKPMRVMATIGIVLGVLAGIGVALLLEMLDRRIRNAEDLAAMLDLPVLGVIEPGRKRPKALPRGRPVPLLRSSP